MTTNDEYKKYTLQAKRCIKGEAFFESLTSDYSLTNHIIAPKDIGIDYICQWVHGDKPSPILYAVQVKTFSIEVSQPKYIEKEKPGFNQLEKYEISNNNLIIDDNTLRYWQTLGMPVYLFAVCDRGDTLDCYYKRFTPVITEDTRNQSEMSFYKVNDGTKFLAFSDESKKIGGFARDLFVDYIRCCYYKGLITYLNPREIGLGQFPVTEYVIFIDLFEIYKEKILRTYNQMNQFIKRYKKS